MFDLPFERGILPRQWLQKAIDQDIIRSDRLKIPDKNLQPASLDLRLGEKAYRLRCSFLPEEQRVEDKLSEYSMGEIDLRDGAILERNRPYLIPLVEELELPADISAKANPRSSTGRLDIFTRVITDRSHRFDEIPTGYKGQLYLEVVSRSFTINVRSELSLNQVRLRKGKTRWDDEEVLELHKSDPILFDQAGPVPLDRIALADGLFLSVDLSRETERTGYRAKKNSRLLDLNEDASYDADEFWEPVRPESKGRLILEPEEFYLLVSAEAVRIPPKFAAEMAAYDPTSGELRTHYAGFFDPGFGHDPDKTQTGTRAVLEVRAHDVPFMLENRQRVCKLAFEEMAEPPTHLYGPEIGSSYQNQELTLSRHFRPMSDSGQSALPL